jgi:hypothetical protein
MMRAVETAVVRGETVYSFSLLAATALRWTCTSARPTADPASQLNTTTTRQSLPIVCLLFFLLSAGDSRPGMPASSSRRSGRTRGRCLRTPSSGACLCLAILPRPRALLVCCCCVLLLVARTVSHCENMSKHVRSPALLSAECTGCSFRPTSPMRAPTRPSRALKPSKLSVRSVFFSARCRACTHIRLLCGSQTTARSASPRLLRAAGPAERRVSSPNNCGPHFFVLILSSICRACLLACLLSAVSNHAVSSCRVMLMRRCL